MPQGEVDMENTQLLLILKYMQFEQYNLAKIFMLIFIVFLHSKIHKIFNAAVIQRLYFKRNPPKKRGKNKKGEREKK